MFTFMNLFLAPPVLRNSYKNTGNTFIKKKAYIPLCFLSKATFQHIVMLLSVEEDLSSFRCEAEIKLPMNKSDSCRQLEKP